MLFFFFFSKQCNISHISIHNYWNQTKFPTQSLVAERGRTYRAKIHTSLWKSCLKHSAAEFSLIQQVWLQLDIILKQKKKTCWCCKSEALARRPETGDLLFCLKGLSKLRKSAGKKFETKTSIFANYFFQQKYLAHTLLSSRYNHHRITTLYGLCTRSANKYISWVNPILSPRPFPLLLTTSCRMTCIRAKLFPTVKRMMCVLQHYSRNSYMPFSRSPAGHAWQTPDKKALQTMIEPTLFVDFCLIPLSNTCSFVWPARNVNREIFLHCQEGFCVSKFGRVVY